MTVRVLENATFLCKWLDITARRGGARWGGRQEKASTVDRRKALVVTDINLILFQLYFTPFGLATDF